MIKALCLAAIIDMGLFFHTNKLEDLIKCETEVLCCYNKSDFDMLIEHLMQGNLLKAHDNKVINISL